MFPAKDLAGPQILSFPPFRIHPDLSNPLTPRVPRDGKWESAENSVRSDGIVIGP